MIPSSAQPNQSPEQNKAQAPGATNPQQTEAQKKADAEKAQQSQGNSTKS